MFLFRGTYLIYIVDSLTLILMSSSTITHSWMKLTEHICFFCKAHQSFLHFGTLESTSALCFGAILKSKITSKIYKNVGNLSLNRQQKRILVHSVRADKKAEQPVFSLICWVVCRVIQVFIAVYMHACPQAACAVSVDFKVTNKFYQVNLQKWNLQSNEDQLYSHLLIISCSLLQSLKWKELLEACRFARNQKEIHYCRVFRLSVLY